MPAFTEFGLIDKLRKAFPPLRKGITGIGDDAAIISGKELVTTDAMVEGVHFISGKISYENLGYKSMAVNVSDIAAMGGEPLYALLSIGLPGNVSDKNIDNLITGISEASGEYSFDLIGGNTSSSPFLFLSVTMIGRAYEEPLLRSGAVTGDYIYVSGTIGDSSIGLALIKDKLQGKVSNPGYFINRHYRPSARIRLINYLLVNHRINSCIDISDGLIADLDHLAMESGKGYNIDAGTLPVSLGEIGADFNKNRRYYLDFSLGGGEDYELIVTSPDIIDNSPLTAAAGAGLTKIGRITEKGRMITLDGVELDPKGLSKGYEHMK